MMEKDINKHPKSNKGLKRALEKSHKKSQGALEEVAEAGEMAKENEKSEKVHKYTKLNIKYNE